MRCTFDHFGRPVKGGIEYSGLSDDGNTENLKVDGSLFPLSNSNKNKPIGHSISADHGRSSGWCLEPWNFMSQTNWKFIIPTDELTPSFFRGGRSTTNQNIIIIIIINHIITIYIYILTI